MATPDFSTFPICGHPECPDTIEHWKPVYGFDLYFVSNHGRVYSIGRTVMNHNGPIYKKPRLLKGYFAKNPGYPRVNLYKDTVSIPNLVHWLVMQEFGEPKPSPHHEINHKSGNKTDNHIDNLEWCTHAENILHGFRVLKRPTPAGKLHAAAREFDNEAILAERAAGHSLRKIAKNHETTVPTILRILRGEHWTQRLP